VKTVSLEEAVSVTPNGATLMIGGFMGIGTPERLIDELGTLLERRFIRALSASIRQYLDSSFRRAAS
jgi:acyl CoA:acetate/3-ketoacid CoA transferase